MNDLTTVLEEHLRGVPLAESLTRLARDDPQLAVLAELLNPSQRTEEAEPASDGVEEARREQVRRSQGLTLRRYLTELTADVNQLQGDVGQLQALVDQFRALVARLAGGLGACPGCLGQDPSCALCRGRGTPGSLPPDPEEFRRLVLPAVRAQEYSRWRSATRPPTSAAPTSDPFGTSPVRPTGPDHVPHRTSRPTAGTERSEP